MSESAIRKNVVMSSDDEFLIDSYLARENKRRRTAGKSKYTFNSLAIDSMREKIGREKRDVAG